MPGERIEVTDGPARGDEQDLGNELVIGRQSEGFGTLKGDPEISRRHAQISRTDEGRLYISDLGSTNGTFVNGKKIEGSAWLAPGDVVKLGQSTLKVGGGQTDAGATRIAPSPTTAPTRAGQSPPPTGGPSGGPPPAVPAPAPSPAAGAGPGAPPAGAPSPGAPPAGAPSPGAPRPAAAPRPGAAPGAPPPGQRPAPAPGGGGGRRLVLIIVGAVVALLVIAGVVLAATGTFSSSEKKPKPPPLTIPSTAATTPTAPATTPTTPTSTGPSAATKAAYIIQFDRVQRSYSKLVAKLIRKARNPSSVQDIINAFKRLKTLYGSTATRVGNLDTPSEIRGVSRAYTATLRVSSAGVNLIIACARARSESCYRRRLNSLSSRTRRIRKKFSRAFRSRGYPVAVLAPS
jgi:hypothetical protein